MLRIRKGMIYDTSTQVMENAVYVIVGRQEWKTKKYGEEQIPEGICLPHKYYQGLLNS